MKAEKLLRQDYSTTGLNVGVNSIEDLLVQQGYLVAIKDDKSFAGIITPTSVLKYAHTLVADCLRERPQIDINVDLESILIQMKENHFSVLPVFEETTFAGVVTLEDITEYYLFKYRKELEYEVKQQTSELKEINKILRQEIIKHKQTWEKLCKARDGLAERVEILEGILPICSYCKDIRDDTGEWIKIEKYITLRSSAHFSHGICDKCFKKYFPELLEDK